MKVDRSYHDSEVIRMYHDRGMMKLAPFATAELGAGWRDYKASLGQKMKSAKLESSEIITILHWSFIDGRELYIEKKDGYDSSIVFGMVKQWREGDKIVFLASDGHYQEIEVDNIINVSLDLNSEEAESYDNDEF